MGQSHAKQILAYLRAGHSITHLEALARFGCARLAARIFDLKELGYDIIRFMIYDERTDKRFARYSMQKEAGNEYRN